MELNTKNFEKLKNSEIWVSNNRTFKFDEDNIKKLHYLQNLICPNEELIDGNFFCYQFRKRSDGSIYWIEMFGKAEYEVHINEYFIHRCEKCNNELNVNFSGSFYKCRFCKNSSND
jgi:hypothetical protein